MSYKFSTKYYRGINKKVQIPYKNKNPFTMWITPEQDVANIYGENGSLFEIELKEEKMNIATFQNIFELNYIEEDQINDAIIDGNEELIDILKKNNYNGMEWNDSGDILICIFDKNLIKSYKKL